MCIVTIFFIPLLMFGCSLAPEEMDWLSLAMVLSRIQFASCSCMYWDILETQKIVIWNLGKILWSRCSAGRSEDFWKQLSLSIIRIQYNYDRTVTLMLLPYFFLLHIWGGLMWDIDEDVSFYVDSVFNFNLIQTLLGSLEYYIHSIRHRLFWPI